MSKSFSSIATCLLKLADRNQDIFAKKFDEIKTFCRTDEKNVVKFAEILLDTVSNDDLSIRLNCVNVADKLFKRSHAFRQRLVDNLQDFFLFTLETDPLHFPMVGSKADAKRLKHRTLLVVNDWHKCFGDSYKKLSLAIDFLKTIKTINIEGLEAETLVERQRKNVEEERRNELKRKTCDQVRREFEDSLEDLNVCLNELENGLNILLPKTEKEEIDFPSTSNDKDLSANGIVSSKQNYEIEIRLGSRIPVEEDSDNADLVKTLKDAHSLLKRKLKPCIESWLKRMTKIGVFDQSFVQTLLDYRIRSNLALKKFEDIKFCRKHSEEEDEEDEFVEVPTVETSRSSVEFLDQTEVKEETLGANVNRETTQSAIRIDIPVLKVDLLLDQPSTSGFSRNDFDCHRFWRSAQEIDDDSVRRNAESLNVRNFNFIGTFKNVDRACGAVLSDGSTCKRMDRQKCPFHGLIGEENEKEAPSTSTSTKDDEQRWKKVAFGDRDLIKDIEASTGISLMTTEGKRKKERRSFQCTSRERLMKKFCNRSSMKRVNSTLDASDKLKVADKFSHQWNYI